MKANEFVKNYGLELSREIVSKQPKWASNVRVSEIIGTWEYTEKVLPSFSIVELKGLVESHELVAIHGFEKSKEIVANAPSDDHFYSWTLGGSGVRDKTVNIGELRKAIADVESCMEVVSESN